MDIYPAKCFSADPFAPHFLSSLMMSHFFLSMGLHQRSFVHIIIKPLCHVTLPRTSINDQQISVHWTSRAHTVNIFHYIKYDFLLISNVFTTYAELLIFTKSIVEVQIIFLCKIQNGSEKTRRKIILLSCKKFVKTQFFGVIEFPPILLIQCFKVVVFPSNFSFQKFEVVVFPSNFWKTTIIWQF